MTLRDVFDKFFKHVKFNKVLGNKLYRYQLAYLSSNKEHLEFFGGNLIGVNTVWFKDSDIIRLFEEVLDVDYIELAKEIRKLTTINHNFKISSDVFNLTMMYCVHRFITTPDISSDKDRERAMYECCLLFFYRTIAALMSDYFRYPADKKEAIAAYGNLSRKNLIKQFGSWHKLMDYRANDLSSKNGIHYNTLKAFDNDTGIVYVINDSQGRIRGVVKIYYAELVKVHNNKESINVLSSTYLDNDNQEKIREKTDSVDWKIVFIKNTIRDKHSFIKDDLVGVICRMNNNTSNRLLKNVLLWITENIDGKYSKEIDEFITTTVVYSYYLINNKLNISNRHDYSGILQGLKNMYRSTRSSDKDLLHIRELGELIINNSQQHDLSESLMMSVRSSVILYITLRTLIN